MDIMFPKKIFVVQRAIATVKLSSASIYTNKESHMYSHIFPPSAVQRGLQNATKGVRDKRDK